MKHQPGETFGSLTLLEYVSARRRWRCRCECGNETLTIIGNLTNGKSKSCRRGTCHPKGKAAPTYKAAHGRLRRSKGAARDARCVDCGEQAAEWSYDGLDPNGLLGTGAYTGIAYSTNPEHYVARCVSCHRRHDFTQRTEDGLCA